MKRFLYILALATVLYIELAPGIPDVFKGLALPVLVLLVYSLCDALIWPPKEGREND